MPANDSGTAVSVISSARQSVEGSSEGASVSRIDDFAESVQGVPYAQLNESTALRPFQSENDVYRITDFTALNTKIDPNLFYDPCYDVTLTALIDLVLASEAPIIDTLLVQRIARAHGFQRAGRLIRDRVIDLSKRQNFIETEHGGARVVWRSKNALDGWSRARCPAKIEDIRQIEEIPLAELKAQGHESKFT